ncbi:MAG: VOC family protein [Chloroflexota bacterium]|nr:VOC family protein [Chloroflexota bacterium]
MGTPVVHFEIRSSDAQCQAAFYSELFGWELGGADEDLMNYRMIDTKAEAGIGGGMVPAQGGLTPGITVYVQVDDLQAALDRAQSLGASAALPPTKLPGPGSFAVVSDPEGNQLGLITR